MSKKEFKKLLTPKFRVSFPAIFEAKSFEGSEPKFEVTMLFDKKYLATDPTAKKLWAEMLAELKKQQAETFKNGVPSNFHFPVRDGDKEKADKDGYAGCYFIKAKSKNKPGVIYYESRKEVTDENEIFPGCIMQASLTCFVFNKISKGLSFGLNNLMFYKEESKNVESFSSRGNAESDFGGVPVEDVPFEDNTEVNLEDFMK